MKKLIVGFTLLCISMIAATKIQAKELRVKGYTDREMNVLAKIVEAEAGDGTTRQKQNVIQCILNRVKSDDFPDSIEAVVFDRGQFTPVTDGSYAKAKPSKHTKKAIKSYFESGKKLHNCLFFCSTTCHSYKFGWFSKLEESFKDGMHAYFTGKRK